MILTSDMPLRLVKERDNEFANDVIAVYTEDKKIGYVANKDYIKYELNSYTTFNGICNSSIPFSKYNLYINTRHF